jgi:hypothetical protein
MRCSMWESGEWCVRCGWQTLLMEVHCSSPKTGNATSLEGVGLHELSCPCDCSGKQPCGGGGGAPSPPRDTCAAFPSAPSMPGEPPAGSQPPGARSPADTAPQDGGTQGSRCAESRPRGGATCAWAARCTHAGQPLRPTIAGQGCRNIAIDVTRLRQCSQAKNRACLPAVEGRQACSGRRHLPLPALMLLWLR